MHDKYPQNLKKCHIVFLAIRETKITRTIALLNPPSHSSWIILRQRYKFYVTDIPTVNYYGHIFLSQQHETTIALTIAPYDSMFEV